MSWDVILVSNDIVDIKQINTRDAPKLGSKSSVIRQLKIVFPDFHLSDPTLGSVIRPKYSIDFSFEKNTQQVALYLNIRGSEDVIDALRNMCRIASWRIFDMTTNLFIDFENDPSRGLKIWQNFRDRVVAQMRTGDEPVVNLYDYAYIIKKKKPWWQFWKK